MIRYLELVFLCSACLFALSAKSETVTILTPYDPSFPKGPEIGLGMVEQFERQGIAANVEQYLVTDPYAGLIAAQRAIEYGTELLVVPEMSGDSIPQLLTDLAVGRVYSGQPEQGGTGLVLGYEWAIPSDTNALPKAVVPNGVSINLDPARVAFLDVGKYGEMSDLHSAVRDILLPSVNQPSPFTLFPLQISGSIPVIGLPFLSGDDGCGCGSGNRVAGICDPDGFEILPEQLQPLPDGRLRMNLHSGDNGADGCGCDGYFVPFEQFSNTEWGIKFAQDWPAEFQNSIEYVNRVSDASHPLMVFSCPPD